MPALLSSLSKLSTEFGIGQGGGSSGVLGEGSGRERGDSSSSSGPFGLGGRGKVSTTGIDAS